MQTNKFEDSQVAEGTMLPGAQHITNTPEQPVTGATSAGSNTGKEFANTENPDANPRNQENRKRRLLGAGTLKGDRVRNKANEDLGSIEEIMIDLESGRVAYAVLSFGGFLGIGDKLFMVPWSALKVDQSAHEFVLDARREDLEKAPGFDKNNWPDVSDPGYARNIHQHYGQTPYWEVTVVDFEDDTELSQKTLGSQQRKTNSEAYMSKVTTMEELFIDELRDLYDAETQLTKALPKMAKAATSEELRNAFEEHLGQTENQVERLKRIFELSSEKPTGKKCAAMVGLIKEGDDMASDTEETPVRDAGLISAAQKVEHYEISGYGSARTHAELLGNNEAVRLLEETLREERETDEKLTQLAQSIINDEAVSVSGDGAGSARNKTTRRPTSGR